MTDIKINVKNAKIYNLKEYQTKNGNKFITFGIRADWNDSKTYWLQCTIWNTSAELLNANLPISFWGYLKGRTYTNKFGIAIDKFNVNVQKWEQPSTLQKAEHTPTSFDEFTELDNNKAVETPQNENDELEWFEDEKETDTWLANEQEEPMLEE